MALVSKLGNWFGKPAAPEPEHAGIDPALSKTEELLTLKKQELLDQVAKKAQAEGKMPTLEDYRLAAQQFAADDHKKWEEATRTGQKDTSLLGGHNWAPIMADLSHNKLNGFQITNPIDHKPGFEVPSQVNYTQIQQVQELAKQEEKENPASHKARATTDLHDLDSDGQINSHPVHDFYDHIRFGDVSNAYVWPATTFNEELAKANKLEKITFDGMKAGDTFTFGSGEYSDITMKNVKGGGELVFQKDTRVTTLNIEGAEAAIAMKSHSMVDNIVVDELTSILTFKMEPGAILRNSDLHKATISMASEMTGVEMHNVTFRGNLSDVDISHGTFNRVAFEGMEKSHLDGLKLNNGTFTNFTLNGQVITHADQLKQFGVEAEGATFTASKEFILEHQVAAIRQKAAGWNGAGQEPANAESSLALSLEAIRGQAANWGKEDGERVVTKPTSPATERSGMDMSYYARMSQTNGRA